AGDRQAQVQAYAETHGRELANLGINLNFAPVVDLDHGQLNPDDRLSQIFRRAIASDSAVVSAVAQTYCQTLMNFGVHCTLKHFPGLGRVVADTHLTPAQLATPVETLRQSDWIPFHPEQMADGAFTMLGHATVTALDPDYPASFSHKIVAGLLRQTWQHNGVLITDDFSMGAVYYSKAGVLTATRKALNSGVDLILIAYDPALYYPIMASLIRAEQTGQLAPGPLKLSRDRLRQYQTKRPTPDRASLNRPSESNRSPEEIRGNASPAEKANSSPTDLIKIGHYDFP
ncbi:MAG: glycoside hydrolase family 3 N-terminal domain-containing protein, partial [Cyanobacteria bacterium P01_D01_bin.128]